MNRLTRHLERLRPAAKPDVDALDAVQRFFEAFPDFRTVDRCSRELGIDLAIVQAAHDDLYRAHRLGAYSLGIDGPPQQHMRALVTERLNVTFDALILEVGPGSNPVFDRQVFLNAVAVDRYPEGQYGNVQGRTAQIDGIATYSTLASSAVVHRVVEAEGGFDLVFGSHSFEHETRPVTGLNQIRGALKPGGYVCLFVPIGWSSDPDLHDYSHTVNLTPEHIDDLFKAAGGFDELVVEDWRPNWDQMVTARRAD